MIFKSFCVFVLWTKVASALQLRVNKTAIAKVFSGCLYFCLVKWGKEVTDSHFLNSILAS